jgi:pilus assembly protein Flp/PilA
MWNVLNVLNVVVGYARRRSARVARDERGGEVIEYALILGLIVVAAIVIIGTVGTKVLARWTSVNSSI